MSIKKFIQKFLQLLDVYHSVLGNLKVVKNIKILPEFRSNFFLKNKNYNSSLFNSFLKVFLNKQVSKKDIPKEFSKIRINEFEKLINVIDDENQFYSHVKKLLHILKLMKIII